MTFLWISVKLLSTRRGRVANAEDTEAFTSGKVQEIKFQNLEGYLFCGSAERFFPEEKIAELAKDAEADALLTFHRYIRKRSPLPVLGIMLNGRTALFLWQRGDRVFVNYYVAKANVKVEFKHWF